MQEITSIKVNLGDKYNDIKIYVLCDLHIGAPECDIDLIKKVVNYIKDTPNMYAICLGDILNTALKNSKSDIYSEVLSMSEAQKQAVELLSPIKEKILAITPGNHENRVWREVGVDLSLWLAEKLNLQEVYRNNLLALNISFGKDSNGNPYLLNVVGQHGAYGSGRKLGSAMSAIEDMDGIIANADIYCRAHTHSNVQGSRKIFVFNKNGNLDTKIKYYFNAPSFLKTGGYGLDKGYKPQDISPCYLNIRAYNERKDTRLEKYFKIDKIML